jgi:1-deoxy-D-xylulose-5-phosphate reductoisomerase
VEQQRAIAILGCTGSIGTQAIEIVRAHPERFRVVALGAGRDGRRLADLARGLGVAHTGLGVEAAVDLAALDEVDVVLNGIVGFAGLTASLAALRAGKTLALANKESLVAGGALCRAAAAEGGGRIAPVDSEHAALAQCLEGREPSTVAALVLTASGGPFRARTDLGAVTPQEALAHPTWAMGPKVTVDSATLMNKGLEVIEAHWLFGFPYDAIRVLVHPQSVVHGIVELVDGSVVMQAAVPDMRVPIQAALGAPARFASPVPPVDLAAASPLVFEPVDDLRFPGPGLAVEAGRRGGTFPAALNAANEIAVAAFLAGASSFLDIPRTVERVLEEHSSGDALDLEQVAGADAWARAVAGGALGLDERDAVLQPSGASR